MWCASTLGVVGCSTIPATPFRELPARSRTLFGPCYPLIGHADAVVRHDGHLVGSAPVDWASRNAARFDFEATDPMGGTAIEGELLDGRFRFEGPIAAQMPKVETGSKDFFLVEDHKVALKTWELPCLLAFRLPEEWTQQFAVQEVEEYRYSVGFDDGEREVLVQFEGLHDWGKLKVCVQLTWWKWLGLSKRRMEWCQTRQGDRWQAHLEGLGDISLDWTQDRDVNARSNSQSNSQGER